MIDIMPTKINGLSIIKLITHEDQRGKFNKVFSYNSSCALGLEFNIKQINTSQNFSIGQIRGMHFQKRPSLEKKMVRCISGKIYDVVVDLRSQSSTFLHWHGEILESGDLKMIHIPEGCAHGFQALEKNSELIYLHSAEYDPSVESGIRYNDPIINVKWPLRAVKISERDKSFDLLDLTYSGIEV
ncbi:dTDP-4-dehydrorhamnose 3,5-epimerase family protein [Gammaproteobacteria bacterium]|nr:dTDP-4-dehydrorhamnose 3,5-epimerase family protein [Gammaproteobacteria bacterium]